MNSKRKRSHVLLALLAPLLVGAQSNVYVANVAGNNISVVSPTFSVIGSVPVALGPTGLGVTPNGASVYVSCQSANVVSVITTSSNSVIANIPVGVAPTQLAISPDGTRVIVSDSGSNQVSIIDTGSNSVIATVNVGSKPSGLTFSRDGSRAFVANSFSNNVSIIDTSSNSVIGTFNVGGEPLAVLVTPNGQRIYVANASSGSVTVHDLSGNLVATVTGFAYPTSLGITPNGSRVFVSNGNASSASVIDTSSNTVIANIGAGSLPTAVAISSDGSKAFVTNEYGFSLSVIDTASNSVINTIDRVGVYPVGVATLPATSQAPAPIAPPCTYSLSGNASLSASGGSGYVTVTTSAGCSWSATSNSGWLSVTSGTSGSGTGTVYFSASANSSVSAVSGSLTIAGQSFTVFEAGNVSQSGGTVPGYSTATFVNADVSTQGNWKGVYGGDGYAIANDATSYPAYAQVSMRNQSSYTWAGWTGDARALQNAGGRIASTWYSSSNFDIDVNLSDGKTHRVALYGLDWDNYGGGRAEKIDILDANTSALLDTRYLSGFTNGQYLVWNLTGHVILRITLTGGGNAVISGLFFGSAGTGSSNPNFVKTDYATQGNWKGVYGLDGYAIANDSTSLPSYAQVSMRNQAFYTWAGWTSDVRALQNAGGRIASTWYADTTFDLDVNLTDGNTHRVSLYGLDWDTYGGGRAERIDVLDANTGAVLDSRNLAGFTNGQYLVWNLTGHVVLRVTLTGGGNAVINGLFFN